MTAVQPTGRLSAEDAEEFTQTLEQSGAGIAQCGAGWWRTRELGQRLGIPDALGVSFEEWAARIQGNVRVLMPRPERREVAAELAAEGLSQREIADVLGVSVGTVNADLHPVQNRTAEPRTVDEPQAGPISDLGSVQNRTTEPEPLAAEEQLWPTGEQGPA